MSVESATYISDLNSALPAASDPKSEGDDHIRLLKTTIKATFPNVNGAVSATDEDLNELAALAGAVVGTTDTQTLTNKTLVFGSNTLTDVASTNTTQTLTNKTINLTSNTLSGTTAQFNAALSDGDFATLAGTETLTNKTLTTPVLGTPTSGNLSNCTADGTNSVGFKHIPQNSQSAAYTLVLGDAGKHIFHPSADTTARVWTIPANASVAYPIGTAITFINQNAAGTITISITTDTLRLAGAGTTGSRTLGANGVATAVKVTSTEWIISGTALT